MPDLTTQYYWRCQSVEGATYEVPSSKGDKTYTVHYGPLPSAEVRRRGYTHGFQCECKGYLYRKECSHTKKAEAEMHCGWDSFLDVGEPVERSIPAGAAGDETVDVKGCPRCGGPVTSAGWAV